MGKKAQEGETWGQQRHACLHSNTFPWEESGGIEAGWMLLRKREDDIFSQQNISSCSKEIKNSEVRQNLICSLTFQRLFMKDSENTKTQRQKSLWKWAQACWLVTSVVYIKLAGGQWGNEQKAKAVLIAFQMTLPQSRGRRWFLFIELT